MDDLLPDNESCVYVYAARYAHARNTGAALQVVSAIAGVWDRLPEHINDQLTREATEAVYHLDDWKLLINRERWHSADAVAVGWNNLLCVILEITNENCS